MLELNSCRLLRDDTVTERLYHSLSLRIMLKLFQEHNMLQS